MNGLTAGSLAKLSIALALSVAAGAQVPDATAQTHPVARTLTVTGQPGEAPLIQSNGKSYIDIESLARVTHGSLQFRGDQVILTLPGTTTGGAASSAQSEKPHLSQAFLAAEIEALTQIREWRAALANAVQNNAPIKEHWVGPLERSAESRVRLAVAASSTVPDHQSVELLRNVFANMQQMSDQFLAKQAKSSYIPPTSFDSNPLDQKILSCERALAAMAATKQFQDEPSCH